MKVQIVSFKCILKNKLGEIVSSSVNYDVINQLEEGTKSLKGLVAGLQNVKAGEKRHIYVPADQAYGLYDPKLVVEVPRKQLLRGDQLEVGSEIMTRSTEDGHLRTFRVINAAEDYVVLDGNHPLAGQDLTFEIEITAARNASDIDLLEAPMTSLTKYIH